MTEKIVLDSDFISSFLAIESLGVPVLILGNHLIIPDVVYDELIASKNEGWKAEIDKMISSKLVEKRNLDTGSMEVMKVFYTLTKHPESGYKLIDKGEAAAIALAVCEQGVLASNNLKDVEQYLERYDLPIITTGTLLYDLFENGSYNKENIEDIWQKMIDRGCKLGARSFSEYLEKQGWKIKNKYDISSFITK